MTSHLPLEASCASPRHEARHHECVISRKPRLIKCLEPLACWQRGGPEIAQSTGMKLPALVRRLLPSVVLLTLVGVYLWNTTAGWVTLGALATVLIARKLGAAKPVADATT